jgi:tRNA(Met) C34 N-acetyltransferase TmcA
VVVGGSQYSVSFVTGFSLFSCFSDPLLSAYEISRLDKYKRDLVDYHQILDLVPTLARHYFKGRVRVKLPQMQQVIDDDDD